MFPDTNFREEGGENRGREGIIDFVLVGNKSSVIGNGGIEPRFPESPDS